MNAFHLKIIAIVTMVIDHIGYFFFPQYIALRFIGRLSFPLFCWFVAEGAKHTQNEKKYLLRMFLFASVSQIPFLLANQFLDPGYRTLNAIFTLSIGLGAIILMRKIKNLPLRTVIAFSAFFLAEILLTDYGGAGVLSIVAFYFFPNIPSMILSQIAIYGTFITMPAIVSSADLLWRWEIIGLLSIAFIALYNGQQGPRAKYLFYVFYPLQYAAIYLLLLLRAT
ncbi:MAG: TraX family protein [Candidatus Paceibacterota bacterium]|jgi:hypothetical protein|nr:conjugal transfer protein TraX [Candidatus Paceibacterota bacterium]